MTPKSREEFKMFKAEALMLKRLTIKGYKNIVDMKHFSII